MGIVIGFLIFELVTFLHIWVYIKVYKSSFGEQPGFAALGRGFVSGAFTNYFFSLLCASLYGGYSGILIIYGLIYSIPTGIFLTFGIWWITNKLELKMGFYSRAVLGGLMGFLLGIFVSAYFQSKKDQLSQDLINMVLLFWSAIGITSGLMASKSESYE